MLRQFSNVWRKRKQTTSATTINNKTHRQSPVKPRTWYWYHPSWAALWSPQHQGPLSIISHSIFKPTTAQPKGPHQHAQSFGKHPSRVAPEGPEQKSVSDTGGLVQLWVSPLSPLVLAFLSPSLARWPSEPCHLSTVQDGDDLTTGQLPREHLWAPHSTNVRTVQQFSLACKKEDLQINSQAKLWFTSMAKAELQHGQIRQGPC